MKHYLVVEDDEMSRMMLADFLTAFAPCDTAENGKEALALFEKAMRQGNPYDLVCVDLMMPVMNGHELVRKIRELEKEQPIVDYVRTKIFVISSSNSPWDMADTILDNVCDDYIVKPLHRDKMSETLQKHNLL